MDGRSPANLPVTPSPTDTPSTQVVYLNGSFIPRNLAKVDIEDRGFVFADGVYEVIRYYHGQALAMNEHVHRLAHSLSAVRIKAPQIIQDLAAISDQLVQANHLTDASIYWQVTRGSAPRNHVIPADITPTTMAIAYKAHDLSLETIPKCVSATIEPDLRWSRCDIKSLMLLANVLAKDQAHEQGAHEAILDRNGVITEGSSTSVLAVRDGVLHTHPANAFILDSITRKIVLKLASELGIKVIEAPMSRRDFAKSDEVMIAGTTTHLAAVTVIDGDKVADGKAGPVTIKLFSALRAFIFSKCPMPQDR